MMRDNAWFWWLLVGVGASVACGGGTSNDAPAAGGTVGVGGSSIGGSPAASGGTGHSSGGAAPVGGSMGSGSTHSGGSEASGGLGGAPPGAGGESGASGGSGGGEPLPGGCDCEAATIPVCGVDGQTYDAGCGSECVPVEIDCSGQCPCDQDAGCGCLAQGTHPYCEEQDGLTYVCAGSAWIGSEATEICADIPTGAVRYCCPLSMPAEAFCPE